ncbi:MAG: hypothetical protein IJU95_03360 [Treponema sp.]|nr:hypothetical protein [Treponema sp.]
MMRKLEKIAKEFNNGLLGSRDAAFEIIHLVMRHKAYFHLQTWTREEIDDFMLMELSHIIHILEDFDYNKAKFSTFFYKAFLAASRYYRRIKLSRIAEEGSLDCMKDMLCEEQDYRYVQNEGELCVESACAEDELRKHFEQSVTDRRNCIMNKMHKRYYHSCADEKMEDLRRSACLVLFLKSSAVADDSALRSTSIVTGVSEDRLFSMMTQLKDKLDARIARRQETCKSRDDAFFLRRKYRVQSGMLDEGSRLYDRLSHCYKVQSERWRRNNVKLDEEYNIAPTNKDVGDMLNISERKVAHILKMARLKIDEIKLNRGED